MLMNATSRAPSKLLHDGLHYLENYEFRLVREALRERDAWIKRAPHLAQLLRLVMFIYQQSRRPDWMIALGLFHYDHLAGKSQLPKARRLSAQELVRRDPHPKSKGLQGSYEFSDGQMDDQALGLWVAEQARQAGEDCRTHRSHRTDPRRPSHYRHEDDARARPARQRRGPVDASLLRTSALDSPYPLDLVRGSHLIFAAPCKQAYLLEAPNDHRIFFILTWQGNTLVGTTEVRQTLNEPIACGPEEQGYLLNAWSRYFPNLQPNVIGSFAGLRPLLRSAQDPSKATPEYAIHRTGKLVTILGGKWTIAMALAEKVSHAIH